MPDTQYETQFEPGKTLSVSRRLFVAANGAGFFFPLANIFQFAQGHVTVAVYIFIANLFWSCCFLFMTAYKTPYGGNKFAIPEGLPFKFLVREFCNPLRITAYCSLLVSMILIVAFIRENKETALFPAFTALAFGVGNFMQSSKALALYRARADIPVFVKAVTHAAVWYGIGYTMAGITISGGLDFVLKPFEHLNVLFLTAMGIVETALALALLASGRLANQAAPFVGVGIGTLFFMASGCAAGNILGFLAASFAGCGEFSLAITMQQIQNKHTNDLAASQSLEMPKKRYMHKIESALTAPIRFLMQQKVLAALPPV